MPQHECPRHTRLRGRLPGMGGWRAQEMQHWKPEMISWLKKTLK